MRGFVAAGGPTAEARRPWHRRVGRATVRALGMAAARWRPGPDFLVIGAKRAGTTFLFRQLESHPAVLPLFPSSRVLPLRENSKGVHYFDTAYGRGATWYRSHFATTARRRLVRRATGEEPVSGEASPYYLFHPHAAARVASALPDARLVVLLRDPVERAYSHFSEQRRNGIEPLGFVEALDAEPSRLAGEEERMEDDPSYVSFAHEHQGYAAQSRYADALARWLSLFPRERICLLCSEELYARPEEQLDVVVTFLGLRPRRLPLDGARNAAPRTPLPPDLRRDLAARFADDVHRLEQLTGRTFPWSSTADPQLRR
jgi:hypothetical protein